MHEQQPPAIPPWLKRLGSRIRQARRVRGLTQSGAAGPELTKSFISLLESGRTYPSVATLVALANRLQTALALLLLDEKQLPRETALSLLALARAKTPESPDAEVEALLAAVDVLAKDAEDLRIEALLTKGDVTLLHGKSTDAERWFEEALGSARRRHQRSYEPRALLRLAELVLGRGNASTARQRVEEALTLFRATRTLRSVDGCEALILQSRLFMQAGKTGRALRTLDEVADVARRYDLPFTLGEAQKWIGLAQAQSGRLDQAVEALRAAKEALGTTGENAKFAHVLSLLAKFCQDVGNLDEAHTNFQQALRIQQRIGVAPDRAVTLNEFAQLQMRRGQLAAALATAKESYELARSLPDNAPCGRALVTMARIARAQRRWKRAAAHLREAVELFRKGKLSKDLADAARELGMLLKERGEHAEAADYLALALSVERGTSSGER